jgi:hypothetical protein
MIVINTDTTPITTTATSLAADDRAGDLYACRAAQTPVVRPPGKPRKMLRTR